MRLLITRTAPQAEATAERVRAMGGEAILSPMLRIRIIHADAHVPDLQAIAFTSVNGVTAFVQQSGARRVPAFCVGDATAEAAHQAGFTAVISADGDVGALAAMIASALDPNGGTILHAAGADIAGDLAGLLAEQGFKAERRAFYAADGVSELPPEARARLTDPPSLEGVVFHSARAAEVFASLAAPLPAATFSQLFAACMSEAVTAKAALLPWKTTIVAPRPREDALLTAAFAQTGAQTSTKA